MGGGGGSRSQTPSRSFSLSQVGYADSERSSSSRALEVGALGSLPSRVLVDSVHQRCPEAFEEEWSPWPKDMLLWHPVCWETPSA